MQVAYFPGIDLYTHLAEDPLRDEVMPKNILMIGPTGVGKTEIARRLAKLTGAPFIKVEATKYTEVGYYGRDVESMVRDLVENAIGLIREVFEVVPRKWRGVGEIPASGLGLKPKYSSFDAEKRFGVAGHVVEESTVCISGSVLRGVKKPHECPAFGKECTPEHPLGATMVSSEGACAAYYRYRKHEA